MVPTNLSPYLKIKLSISHLILSLETFPADVSPTENEQKQSQITHLTSVPFSSTIVHNVYNVNTNFKIDPIVWTLFFDGYRSKEGAGA